MQKLNQDSYRIHTPLAAEERSEPSQMDSAVSAVASTVDLTHANSPSTDGLLERSTAVYSTFKVKDAHELLNLYLEKIEWPTRRLLAERLNAGYPPELKFIFVRDLKNKLVWHPAGGGEAIVLIKALNKSNKDSVRKKILNKSVLTEAPDRMVTPQQKMRLGQHGKIIHWDLKRLQDLCYMNQTHIKPQNRAFHIVESLASEGGLGLVMRGYITKKSQRKQNV